MISIAYPVDFLDGEPQRIRLNRKPHLIGGNCMCLQSNSAKSGDIVLEYRGGVEKRTKWVLERQDSDDPDVWYVKQSPG